MSLPDSDADFADVLEQQRTAEGSAMEEPHGSLHLEANSIEADTADVLEQHQDPSAGGTLASTESGAEADIADVAEQAAALPGDDDDHERDGGRADPSI